MNEIEKYQEEHSYFECLDCETVFYLKREKCPECDGENHKRDMS